MGLKPKKNSFSESQLISLDLTLLIFYSISISSPGFTVSFIISSLIKLEWNSKNLQIDFPHSHNHPCFLPKDTLSADKRLHI